MGINYFAPFRWGLERTPNASNANNVRICNAGNGGALNNNNANNSNGAAPIGGICLFQVPKGKAVRLPQGVDFLSPQGAKRAGDESTLRGGLSISPGGSLWIKSISTML